MHYDTLFFLGELILLIHGNSSPVEQKICSASAFFQLPLPPGEASSLEFLQCFAVMLTSQHPASLVLEYSLWILIEPKKYIYYMDQIE